MVRDPSKIETWWRHQMETFSTLLAICAGNSPVPGEFPAQRPVTQSFHPCEKVIGIFFWHKFIIICFFVFFAQIFIHNIYEVVNINSNDFVGLRSLASPRRHFEKGYWVKTRCRISLIIALCKDGIGTWGKRPVLVHSLSVGGSYESITNYRKPVVTHKLIH